MYEDTHIEDLQRVEFIVNFSVAAIRVNRTDNL